MRVRLSKVTPPTVFAVGTIRHFGVGSCQGSLVPNWSGTGTVLGEAACVAWDRTKWTSSLSIVKVCVPTVMAVGAQTITGAPSVTVTGPDVNWSSSVIVAGGWGV